MYVLTLANGAVLTFYVESCAEIFQQCWGGELSYRELAVGETLEDVVL